MKLSIPNWIPNLDYFRADGPTIAATSGGLTSGVMAALFHSQDAEVEYCLWNTGREHPGTYIFLGRLSECLPLRFFEVRKPAIHGAGPSQMRFEEVAFTNLDRTGRPFKLFLETIADYRRMHKDAEPIGPNPVMRLCTAYMKDKLSGHVADALWGADAAWTSAVGLRADEPRRIAKMSSRDTARKSNRAPLHEAGITKCHVEEFWKEQPFTLDIPPHQGNCTLCFLKDEADIADILATEPDPDENGWEWWKELDDRFAIRGRGNVGYRQIERESPMRFAIRESLVQIRPLPDRADFDPRRFKLLVRQESKILREGRNRVPCSCESAEQMTDDYVGSTQEMFDFELQALRVEQ